MHLLLLLVGVIGILGGLAGIGYGVVNPESRMVDTLAICGTVGLIGGFGLIGLGSLVSRLRRVAEALEMQPFPPRNLVETRAPDLHAGYPPAGNPFGPPPVPRAEEATPQLATPAPADAPAIAPPPMPPPSPTSLVSESAPKAGRFSTPPGEWPRLDPADRPVAAQNGATPAAEPASVTVAPPVLPPLALTARDAPTASPGSGAEQAADAPRVLKSGVIEGMAYTLYSDGSVDAEFPNGTLHFASISEWRAHLRVGA